MVLQGGLKCSDHLLSGYRLPPAGHIRSAGQYLATSTASLYPETASFRLQATSAALDNTSPRGATSRREKLQPNQRDPSFEFGNLTSQVGRCAACALQLVVRCETLVQR